MWFDPSIQNSSLIWHWKKHEKLWNTVDNFLHWFNLLVFKFPHRFSRQMDTLVYTNLYPLWCIFSPSWRKIDISGANFKQWVWECVCNMHCAHKHDFSCEVSTMGILLIRVMVVDLGIVSINTEPYILQKILDQFVANVLRDKMGTKKSASNLKKGC